MNKKVKTKEERINMIYEFIHRCPLGVISTQNVLYPESSLVAFGELKTLELVFGTYNDTRKYKNIINNPAVSFVIGWDQNITVQYEGDAVELDDTEVNNYTGYFFKKNPSANITNIKERYFKVIPHWVRYVDNNTKEVFEISMK